MDEWDCAVRWLPILLIENTKEAIGMSASLDGLRNEVISGPTGVIEMLESKQTQEELSEKSIG